MDALRVRESTRFIGDYDDKVAQARTGLGNLFHMEGHPPRESSGQVRHPLPH